MKRLLRLGALFAGICFPAIIQAQKTYTNLEWVSSGPAVGTDYYHTASVVHNGNLIVTGNILNGTHTDVYTYKLDNHGDTLWAKSQAGSLTGGGNDYGIEIAVTNSGDIIVTAAVENNSTGYDYAIYRYSGNNGALEWSYVWDGNGGIDIPAKVVVKDAINAIFVVGGSQASGGGLSDFGLLKVDTTGAFKWEHFYGGTLHDAAVTANTFAFNQYLLAVGASNQSPGTWAIVSRIVKVSDGSTFSTSTVDTTGATMVEAKAMVMDSLNNIYITGYGEVGGDKYIETIMLDSNLNEVWVQTLDNPYDDAGNDIAIDADGNVYVVGYTELSTGGYNIVTVKYQNDGTEEWVREIGNVIGLQDARGEKIEVADNGNIFITGTIETGSQTTIELARYNPYGKLTLHKTIESDTVNYRAYDLALSGDDIYISGLSYTDASGTSTVAKFSLFERNQSAAYTDTVPIYVDDMVLIRFNPDDLLLNKVDDPNIRWGLAGDFVDSTALAAISDSVGFDVSRQICYKVFPNFKSTDTVATTRFGTTMKLPPYYSTFGLILPDNTDDSTAIVQFNSAVPHVILTGHNIICTTTTTANDPYYTGGNFAGLDPTVAYPNANINIERAWDYETGIPSVIVGVYDRGINYAHADWSDGTYTGSSVQGGYDYYNDMPLTSQTDPDNNGHGTACASIIGAWRNNSYGIAGIAGGNGTGGVTIHDMKWGDNDVTVMEACDSNWFGLELEDIANSIAEGSTGTGHVTEAEHIQNHSWNMNFPPNAYIREAFITAYHAGVVVFVSSGNGGGHYPACQSNNYPGNYADHMIILVGGNDTTGGHWHDSFCPTHLDFIAPSIHELYICLGHQGNNFTDGLAYGYMMVCSKFLDGTSLAAPHAAGVAGLMLSYAQNNPGDVPELSIEDCEYLMEHNATQVGATQPEIETGWGRLDAGGTFDHFWYPKYIIEHHSFGVLLDNATLDATGEYTCLEESMFGLPAGSTIKVNRYSVTASNSHSAPSGYILLDGWARGSESTNMIGIVSTSTLGDVDCDDKDNEFYIRAEQNPTLNSFSATSATMTGYIYEITDWSGNHLGWWPVDTLSDAAFAYTLYWENPLITGIPENGESSFKLYPNPSNSQCTIELSHNNLAWNDIILVDITGQLVKTIATADNFSDAKTVTFNVDGLSQGMYYVVIRTNEKSLIQKLIISQ